MRMRKTESLKVLAFALIIWRLWPGVSWAQTNPGLATIEFTRAAYTANENARAAIITLRRSGNTNGAVSVELSTEDGTARAGTNYVARTGPVIFAANKTEAKFSIPLIDDLKQEGNRTVKLVLSNPTGGATLGPQSTAELTILDNDNSRTAWLNLGLERVPWLRRTLFDIPLWNYLASLIYIFLAFYVSKLLDFLIRGQLQKWARKTQTEFDDLLLELLRGPLKVVVFVILLHIGLRVFSWPVWFSDFTAKALKIVVAVSITYLVLRFIDLGTGYWKKRAADEADHSFIEQLLPVIRNSLKVFAVVVATLLTLQNLGLNITSLIASLSIGGLAIGLAAQDTLANFFGAVVVVVDKPFRIGDQIRLDPVEGTVENIGFRSTRVRTADGHLVAIPNKIVGNAIITNMASRPQIRTVLNVGISGDTPSDKVKRAVEILEEVFRKNPLTREVLVTFNKLADSALNIQVVHLWNGTDGRQHLQDLQQVNLEIKDRFGKEGIQLAFPTQTVSVKREGRWVSQPSG